FLAAGDVPAKGSGESERRHRVDSERHFPGGSVDRARRHLARPDDAGIGDEDVDSNIAERRRQSPDSSEIGGVEGMNLDVAGDGAQLSSLGRLAAGRDDPPTRLGILPGEFKTETATGAGQQNSRHDLPPRPYGDYEPDHRAVSAMRRAQTEPAAVSHRAISSFQSRRLGATLARKRPAG